MENYILITCDIGFEIISIDMEDLTITSSISFFFNSIIFWHIQIFSLSYIGDTTLI